MKKQVGKEPRFKGIKDEEWKEVAGSEGLYFVSNYGRVKSFSFKKDGQIMKCPEIKGFKSVNLKINKIRHFFYLHKLVAEIWLPKPSEQHTFVTHLDGILKNNHISNLKWLTKEELTLQHREFKEKNNIVKRPKIVSNSKLKEKDIVLIKTMLQRGVTQLIIAKMFRISDMQVSRIKRGENWGHVLI